MNSNEIKRLELFLGKENLKLRLKETMFDNNFLDSILNEYLSQINSPDLIEYVKNIDLNTKLESYITTTDLSNYIKFEDLPTSNNETVGIGVQLNLSNYLTTDNAISTYALRSELANYAAKQI